MLRGDRGLAGADANPKLPETPPPKKNPTKQNSVNKLSKEHGVGAENTTLNHGQQNKNRGSEMKTLQLSGGCSST